MTHFSTINSKGQVTVPKSLRDKHHLGAGVVVTILDSEDGVLIRRGPPSMRGMLKGALDSEQVERDVRRLRKEWGR